MAWARLIPRLILAVQAAFTAALAGDTRPSALLPVPEPRSGVVTEMVAVRTRFGPYSAQKTIGAGAKYCSLTPRRIANVVVDDTGLEPVTPGM